MNQELQSKLEKDFPFMEKHQNQDNTYSKYGCECYDGWYPLLHDLCQEIQKIYQNYQIKPDILILQIKEKFAALRFYYTFENEPCSVQAIDFLNSGQSLRLYSHNDDNNAITGKLRSEIRQTVQNYEQKSKTICEFCGDSGQVRNDIPWMRTLCNACYANQLAKFK
jgi:hypothetical protein